MTPVLHAVVSQPYLQKRCPLMIAYFLEGSSLMSISELDHMSILPSRRQARTSRHSGRGTMQQVNNFPSVYSSALPQFEAGGNNREVVNVNSDVGVDASVCRLFLSFSLQSPQYLSVSSDSLPLSWI